MKPKYESVGDYVTVAVYDRGPDGVMRPRTPTSPAQTPFDAEPQPHGEPFAIVQRVRLLGSLPVGPYTVPPKRPPAPDLSDPRTLTF